MLANNQILDQMVKDSNIYHLSHIILVLFLPLIHLQHYVENQDQKDQQVW